jgi:hypothetical protein
MTDQTSFNLDAATPAQAAARLETVRNDDSWQKRLLAKDATAWREFTALSEKATGVSADGTPAGVGDSLPPAGLSFGPHGMTSSELGGHIGHFSEQGIGDAEITEFFSDRTYSRDEVIFAQNRLADRFADKEWDARRKMGGIAETREFRRLNMIIAKAA